MKKFEEIWAVTDQIPGSFTVLSGRVLFSHLCAIPRGGWVAEIGVDQGRSASIILEVAEENGLTVFLVDSWESVLVDNKYKVERLVGRYPKVNHGIIQMKSVEAVQNMPLKPILDLIHIDAHHFDDVPDGGPSLDCEAWLPKLKPGGIAAFHDYNSCFPDVNKAVDKYTEGWRDLGCWDGLAIRRKP